MIVDPDFLEHWRTRMLVDALGGDEMAPFYVLRIWGHCQQRRGDRFAMPAAGLKALCKASGDAQDLEAALVDAGFVVRDGADIYVPKWAEKNSSLFAAWENGGKGGRPKGSGKPKENPRVTQQEPTANPDETQTKPIREEKRREEEKSPPASRVPPAGAGGRPAKKCPASFAITDEMRAWAVTEAPGVLLDRETDKFKDHTFKTALVDWLGAWRNWMRRAAERPPTGPPTSQRSFRERDAEAKRAEANRWMGSAAPQRGDVIDMETNDAPRLSMD